MKMTFDAKSKRHFDENGFLHVAVSNISKEDVNPYLGWEVPRHKELGLDPQKLYYVFRSGKELEKCASTFRNLSLMRNHHDDSADNPQREHRVGSVGSDCAYREPYLQCSLCVTDGEAIRKIENGERMEISAGYFYDPVMESGEFNGKKYDIIMTNIRGNHVALVDEGRAGNDVVVADSAKNISNTPTKGKGMTKKYKSVSLALDAATAALKMAKDSGEASEAIEQAEADIAKAALAVQRIEADMEGDSPEDFGINDDSMDAMKACGLDAENEAVRKAWAEGVKYGEKLEKNPAERKKLDSEHESAGMKQAMDEDPTADAAQDADAACKDGKSPQKTTEKPVGDAKRHIVLDEATLRKNIMEDLRDVQKAALAVKPYVGELNSLTYDSAGDVYVQACQLVGIDATRATAKDAFGGYIAAMQCGLSPALSGMTLTTDSAQAVSRFK